MAFQANAFQNNVTGSLKGFQVTVQPLPPGAVFPGGTFVAHQFTRRRWDELQELIEAEAQAREQALAMQASREQAALKRAADAAMQVILAARQVERIRGETEAIDRVLQNNAAALRAASDANTRTWMLYEANAAVRMSRQLGRAIEDETDEMIHLLLLS